MRELPVRVHRNVLPVPVDGQFHHNSRDPAAMDGLAAVAALALKDFGDAAVPTLVAVARMEPEDEVGHTAAS